MAAFTLSMSSAWGPNTSGKRCLPLAINLVHWDEMGWGAWMFELGTEITLLLFGAGVAAGALNAVAGGATFFTFPALILSGLSPLVANATNFVALVPSNFAALPAFRAELKALGRELAAPISTGAFGGLIFHLLEINHRLPAGPLQRIC